MSAATCVACSFSPGPLIVYDPSFRSDATTLPADALAGADATVGDAGERDADTIRDDAGVQAGDAEADAGVASASDANPRDGAPPDAAPADATAPDAAAPDARVPDAAAPDAGPPDARPPDAAAPDAAAPDAAAPDATIDAGTPDGGCPSPPWLVDGVPRVAITSAATIAPIDVPPLVADFDGDGLEEVAVASTQSGQLAVLDWPACAAAPDVTVVAFFASQTGLALATLNGREVITSVNGGTIQFARYDGPALPITTSAGGQAAFSDLGALTVHPDGTEIIADGQRTGGGYAYVVPRVTSVVRSLPDEPLGGPAYVSGVPGGARYAITTATALVIAQPDRPADQPLPLGAAPTTGPVVLGGNRFASAHVAIAYGATGPSPTGLGVSYVDPSTAVQANAEFVPTPDRALGEPIAYASAAGPAGFFQLRDTSNAHVIGGCVLGPRPPPAMGHTCTPIGSALAIGATVPPRATPITAYLSASGVPDLVVATQAPARLVFAPPTLANAGPTVTLSSGAVATPALSERFLARYNLRGTAVFVPEASGVELVVWIRPAAAGARTSCGGRAVEAHAARASCEGVRAPAQEPSHYLRRHVPLASMGECPPASPGAAPQPSAARLRRPSVGSSRPAPRASRSRRNVCHS